MSIDADQKSVRFGKTRQTSRRLACEVALVRAIDEFFEDINKGAVTKNG